MSLASVFRYIARWGVAVAPDGPVTHDAPYGVYGGIHWPTRTIVTHLDGHGNSWKWDGCLLVHELSHVLIGTNPSDVDEVSSGMLALDHIGCRLLKLAWSDWMEEFHVDDKHWSLMTKMDRYDALHWSRLEAIGLGLLNERGRPTFQRHDQPTPSSPRG